ncbi:MAG: Asp-tRNA(Asn)/Glu-tRNA(Gln) amidotransferase subunit GatA [Hydrogenophilus sp.]|nr:Asp-tRNA(Asn)/Glu-tRNA(Gln) amidotransferase subunit GatA [Hydrogenophilus sp.]
MTPLSSLSELLAALAQGKATAQSLVACAHARAKALQPTLNAFISLAEPEQSAAAARRADQRRAHGVEAPLLGIPIAHKDLFVTTDLPTTAASRMLLGYRSPFDATVVERLAAAGAIAIGKTNLDEFAMGSGNEHSFFGPARNPWDPTRVPGGSSGGSAAAVAAAIVPAATGTDTGGSVRQPAAHCGITGLKPTYGRVSRYGIIAYASSLDQAGLFARSAWDIALLLRQIAGHDPRDSTSVDCPVPDYPAILATLPPPRDRPLVGWRIGIVPSFLAADGVQSDILAALEAARRTYEQLGAAIVECTLPAAELAIPAYYIIAPAEASSNLARYDGVRYGHRTERYDDLFAMYCQSRAEGFGWEVKRRILIGTFVLSHGYYDAYYRKAQQVRRLVTDGYRSALEQCDLLLTPVTATTAWPIGAKANPVEEYLADLFTIGPSLAGLPALAHPIGFDAAGLPIGAQIIGRPFDEARLLAAAHIYQQATDWHRALPPLAHL